MAIYLDLDQQNDDDEFRTWLDRFGGEDDITWRNEVGVFANGIQGKDAFDDGAFAVGNPHGPANAKPENPGGGGGGGNPGGGGGGGGGGKGPPDPALTGDYRSGATDTYVKAKNKGDFELAEDGTYLYVGNGSGDYDKTVDNYNIDINFIGGNWTAEYQQAVTDAADFLSSIIQSGLVEDPMAGFEHIDDVEIDVDLKGIDGPGRILGSGDALFGRDPGTEDELLPLNGTMDLDLADASDLMSIGKWGGLVLHEMMHVLGLGTAWHQLGLVSLEPAVLPIYPIFNGTEAILAFQESGGTLVFGGLPLDWTGEHWDEGTFGSELMTPGIDTSSSEPEMFLGTWTVAALQDMGYDVDWQALNPEDLDISWIGDYPGV